ncbi:MAG: histidine phosphatase family protein [Thermoanaerobaculia bacterium]|nr:histidine phosphatase family protein [Thermoanaerobaculia bacterium]
MKKPTPTFVHSLAASLVVLLALSAVSLAIPSSPEEAAEGEELLAPATRTLYLIRHGDYDHADDRDPEVGKALVPIGVAQARLVGARLRGMPVAWDALYTSPMTRALETAKVIGDDLGMEPEVSRNLRECTPPTWREDIMKEEKPEDLAACEKQLDEAFAQFFQPAKGAERHEIVSAHGNVIRSFLVRALGVDKESWLGMSIGNCSLTVIQVKPDGAMKVLAFSDVGHIPPNLQTRTSPGEPRDLKVP